MAYQAFPLRDGEYFMRINDCARDVAADFGALLKSRIFLIVFVASVIALVGWRYTENQKKAAATAMAGPGGGAPGGGGGGRGPGGPGGGGGGRASAVEVAAAAPATIDARLQAVGTAESPFRVELSPRASGRIESISVREGDAVKVGQVLATLDPSELQQRVLQQQASVAEARSRLAQAELGAGPNVAGVQGAISQAQAQLRQAKANYSQLKGNYDAQVAAADAAVTEQEGRVASAKAQVRNAQATLDRENASLTNLVARYERLNSLLAKGYVAGQEVDNARTAADVQRKQVDVAQAQLSAATSAVASAEASLASTKNQAQIVRRKGKSDIAAGAAAVARAQADVRVAGANRATTGAYQENIAALRASLAAAQAQLEQAQVQLRDSSIRSSIDGVVTARNADPGALASPGQPVLVVQSLDWLYVAAAVPLEQSGGLKVGQSAQVTFDSLPGQTFEASVANINPAADIASRQVEVRLKLMNPGHIVKPGMYAQVGFLLSRKSVPVAVPREAIRMVNGQSVVSVVDAEGTAHDQEVKVGATDGKLVEIADGLKPGDQVITLTFQPVRDGQKVQLPGQKDEKKGDRRGPRQ